MRKIFLALTLPLVCAASAKTLTPEEALSRLAETPLATGLTRSADTPRLVYTETAPDGVPSLYVFNRNDRGGYMILSADDCAAPLLGYSDEGAFDIMNMPPAMRWWLRQYSGQIAAYSSKSRATRAETTRVAGGNIAPLIKTKWNQGAPYNDRCPELNGTRCVTGCVATAMAQVMNYHRYPEKGTGVVSINLAGTPSPLSLDLAEESFNWTAMLDDYAAEDFTEAQSGAVAYLMEACGYSVGMNYSTTESGASSYYVGKALIANFGYNENISMEEREYYNSEDWNQMVYDELASNRPVYYSGQSEGGGHAFVCDGYAGDGYFHINWGWGGMSDGYFLLQSLNPSDLGIGGGTGGGFSFDQMILKGVQPAATGTEFIARLFQSGYITGNKSSTSRIFFKAQGKGAGWWNMSYRTLNLNIGVRLEPETAGAAQPCEIVALKDNIELKNVELSSLRGFNEMSFMFPVSLPDGRYKATVCTQDASEENSSWIPVACPEFASNSFFVTKSGSKYSVEFNASKTIAVENAEITSPLHYGSLARMSVTFANNTDTELSQTIAPVLMKQGVNRFEGTGIPVLLKPGETVTREVVVEFSPSDNLTVAEPMDFLLKFQNVSDGSVLKFSKTVTMEPKSDFALQECKLSIAGAQCADEDGREVWLVKDKQNIVLNATVSCSEGFFGFPIYTFLFPGEGGQNISGMDMTPALIVSEGETQTISGQLNFDQGKDGEMYFLAIYYYDGGWKRLSDILVFRLVSESGIDGTTIENGFEIRYDKTGGNVTVSSPAGAVSVKVMSFDGRTLLETQTNGDSDASVSLDSLPAGFYIISAKDAVGNVKSLKIAK